MRYIITGRYANGDDYMESVDNLADLAYILSDIDRFDTERTTLSQRVYADSINIETEDEDYSLRDDHAGIKKQIKDWEGVVDTQALLLRRIDTPATNSIADNLESVSHEMMAVNI